MANVVTVEDCKDILKNCFNDDLVKYKSHILKSLSGEVQGYLSEHCLLLISFEKNHKIDTKSFFVKIVLENNSFLSIFATALDVFRKENFIYTKFFPELESLPYFKYIQPKCYLIKKNMLVMEDLTEDKFKIGEKLEFYDFEQCKAALDSVAHYHAYGILFEKQNSKDGVFRLNVEFPKEFEEKFLNTDEGNPARQFVEACLISVIDLVEEIPIETFPKKEYFQELFGREFEDIPREEKYQTRYVSTCMHGDLWANNIMFKYDEEDVKIIDCKLIDFQLLSYGMPGFDIEVFFYGNTTATFRNSHKEELLKHYHECLSKVLSKNGVAVEKLLPFNSLNEMCTLKGPAAKIQAFCDMCLLYLPKEIHENTAKNPELYENVLVSERSHYILELYRSNENFRKIANEELLDLMHLLEAKEELLKKLEQNEGMLPKHLGTYS